MLRHRWKLLHIIIDDSKIITHFYFLMRRWIVGIEIRTKKLTNVPVGTNIEAIIYGYSSGNVLYDPVLPLEDIEADIHAIGAA